MALLGSPRAYLGLDIGTSHIKLVELIDRGNRHELATYADAPVSPSINPVDLITRMLDKAQTSADALIMSLPNSATFCTRLTLPDIPKADLTAAIKFKASEVVPTPLDDVELTWHKQPGGVYLVAAAKGTVADYRRLADQLNLKLVRLEAEILPLIRTHAVSSRQNILFCNIGELEVTLHVANHGFPLLSRTVGGSLKSLVQEVMDTVKKQPISKIILLGDTARLTPLRDRLTKPLNNLSIIISNPWQSLSYPEGLLEDSLTKLGPKYAVAVGLAKSKLPAL